MMPYAYTPDFYTDFYYDADAFAMWLEQMWPTLVPIAVAVVGIFAVLYLVFYVFGSLSIYTMAERRGFAASFVAWIPFVRWSMLGRVASDVHRARTGKRAFYGIAILLLTLCPVFAAVYGVFATEPQGWVFLLSWVCSTVYTFVMLFALSEVYRDYSRCWVGMLIFTCLIPVLRPIFLLAIHKNVPVSVRIKHAQTPTAAEGPVSVSAPAEQAVPTEQTAPAESEVLTQGIENVPAFENGEEASAEEPAAEGASAGEGEEEFETSGV